MQPPPAPVSKTSLPAAQKRHVSVLEKMLYDGVAMNPLASFANSRGALLYGRYVSLSQGIEQAEKQGGAAGKAICRAYEAPSSQPPTPSDHPVLPCPGDVEPAEQGEQRCEEGYEVLLRELAVFIQERAPVTEVTRATGRR